jgi:hypothetical protein
MNDPYHVERTADGRLKVETYIADGDIPLFPELTTVPANMRAEVTVELASDSGGVDLYVTPFPGDPAGRSELNQYRQIMTFEASNCDGRSMPFGLQIKFPSLPTIPRDAKPRVTLYVTPVLTIAHCSNGN